MTPKQKAAELILMYMAIVVKQDIAKKCALAAVDEIMKNNSFPTMDWWKQVKQEIKNL
jgi:hypothetical protein